MKFEVFVNHLAQCTTETILLSNMCMGRVWRSEGEEWRGRSGTDDKERGAAERETGTVGRVGVSGRESEDGPGAHRRDAPRGAPRCTGRRRDAPRCAEMRRDVPRCAGMRRG